MAYRFRNLVFAGISFFGLLTSSYSEQPEVSLSELSFHVASNSRIRNVRFGKFNERGQLIGSTRIGFRTSGRSLKYEYKGPLPLTFFEETKTPTPDNPDNVTRTVVAQISPPTDKSDLLFLFSRNPSENDSGLQYSIDWIDTNIRAVPSGHITIFNTLPIEFEGGIQQSKNDANPVLIKTKPGINPPIDIEPKAKVILALNSNTDGLLRAYEDTVHCGRDERILLVIFPPRFPGSYQVGSKIISIPSPDQEKNKTDPDPKSTE